MIGENTVCKSCGRIGCWTDTNDPNYIQCKCGEEILNGEKTEKNIKHLSFTQLGNKLEYTKNQEIENLKELIKNLEFQIKTLEEMVKIAEEAK